MCGKFIKAKTNIINPARKQIVIESPKGYFDSQVSVFKPYAKQAAQPSPGPTGIGKLDNNPTAIEAMHVIRATPAPDSQKLINERWTCGHKIAHGFERNNEEQEEHTVPSYFLIKRTSFGIPRRSRSCGTRTSKYAFARKLKQPTHVTDVDKIRVIFCSTQQFCTTTCCNK